ncbi:MAG: single-stranded DNA-binding protein [Clostridiales bacterium]|nr:single-stranded DNA-binding protein [Clostridiales bacterium]
MKMSNNFSIQGCAYIPKEEGILFMDVDTNDGRKTVKCKFKLRHETGSKKEGEAYAPADFFEFEAWGNTAKYVIENIQSGDGLIVNGHIKIDKYKNKNGESRQRIVLVCDELYRTYGAATTKKAVEEDDEEEAEEEAWQSTAKPTAVASKPASIPTPAPAPAPAAAAQELPPELPPAKTFKVNVNGGRVRRPYGEKIVENADTGLLD